MNDKTFVITNEQVATPVRSEPLTEEETTVERGAAWLDVRYPGWWRKIDPDTLDIAAGDCCIGGQLLGDDTAWLRLRDEFRRDHGDLDANGRYILHGFSNPKLTEPWRRLIRARQEA